MPADMEKESGGGTKRTEDRHGLPGRKMILSREIGQMRMPDKQNVSGSIPAGQTRQ